MKYMTIRVQHLVLIKEFVTETVFMKFYILKWLRSTSEYNQPHCITATLMYGNTNFSSSGTSTKEVVLPATEILRWLTPRIPVHTQQFQRGESTAGGSYGNLKVTSTAIF